MVAPDVFSREEKAYILVLDPQGREKNRITVHFNPSEYSLDTSNQFQYTTIPGLSSPITQFISGSARTLTMDLFFDTYEEGEDVRNYTKKIDTLLKIDPELHAPPICKFVWGGIEFKAVVEKASKKFTMFLSNGVPVRATVNVTFKEYKTLEEELMKSRRASADKTKRKIVKEGDTLWLISAREYGDPGEWRHIAKANGIVNPRILYPGMELTIPRLG